MKRTRLDEPIVHSLVDLPIFFQMLSYPMCGWRQLSIPRPRLQENDKCQVHVRRRVSETTITK